MTLDEYLKRMLQELQLRGMSESTQESYLYAVRKISEHYHKTTDQITEEELREYFRYLKNVKKYGRRASTLAMCGLKFFYPYILRQNWPTLTLVRAPHDHRFLVVLSQEEVRRVLAAVRLFRHRACLSTSYACGLSLTEGTTL